MDGSLEAMIDEILKGLLNNQLDNMILWRAKPENEKNATCTREQDSIQNFTIKKKVKRR